VSDTALLSRPGGAEARVGEAESTAPVNPGRRSPPKTAQILLPVWGYEFARQFLDRSLSTLLASGNLPAVAAALPTEFVFLTSKRDETMIREHPAYRRLAAVCAIRFEAIDDLITEANHTTTITLAYARAVRRAGPAMLDTCFFFLVSDFLIADGSLASVMAQMQAGVSAVQVGNFQVVEEEAAEWLRKRFGKAETVVLPPRELLRWALTCMHPATAANTVNYPICHNTHSNRLFWRVDDDTLIGRFYLMHMICVRPETADFVIGASCDYSFVPEMCPSGNVVTLTDSTSISRSRCSRAPTNRIFSLADPPTPERSPPACRSGRPRGIGRTRATRSSFTRMSRLRRWARPSRRRRALSRIFRAVCR